MQRKGCGAPGDSRNVPYEKLTETGDGARARLPCLSSSSTRQQCACSGRKLAVLPVRVSGFLWACVQVIVYVQPPVCVRPWVSGSEGVWARVQTDVLHSDFLPRVQEWTENQIWLQSQGKVGGGISQCYISDTDVSQLATNTNNEQLHTARVDINDSFLFYRTLSLHLSANYSYTPGST